jgi:predicted dehydrogenase
MKFAVIGIDHGHVYMMINNLLAVPGVQCVGYYTDLPALEKQMTRAFPDIPLATNEAELLERRDVDLIVSAGIPSERALLAVRAMNHGKDFFGDAPFPTTLQHLELLEATQARTHKSVFIYLRERLLSRAEQLAGRLIRAGEIGRPVNFIGIEPHKLMPGHRPPWQFKKALSGGILCELGVHVLDSFCFLTGQAIKTGRARVGNVANFEHSEFEDFGDATFQGVAGATGYARVDWLTPDTLPSFGDLRCILTGTEGYLEVRKKIDLAVDNNRYTGDQLLLCSKNREPERVDCRHIPITFHEQLVRDVIQGVNRCIPHQYVFRLMRNILEMNASAEQVS